MSSSLLLVLAAALFPAAASAQVRMGSILRQPDAWYATAEARAAADNIVLYQTPEGGWPKNTDMTQPPSAGFLADTRADHRAATIDNGATHTQLRLLARVIAADPDGGAGWRESFDRGLDYLLAAQYPNGGWPQYFPLRPGYYTHITYNDDAMVRVLELLRDAASGQPPFAFVDPDRRARAAAAVARGVNCILQTQVRRDGRLTAWGAQHDETTLAPAWARNFEPPTLSGQESTGIVRFLMSLPDPSPEIIAAVEGAVSWLEKVAVSGVRIERGTNADGQRDPRAVADPAAPVLWARFYELDTDRPVFTGRDKVIRYDFNAIERERRGGYAYYGTWPQELLRKEYPRWLDRLGRTKPAGP